ncbi:fibronectin type III domain-containing protein [Terrisporobacter mayombei]|uniref:Fibronectin type-III domain-containing protein n=1 Tax=Terrisporobacter mayombei TaxID=1541 RepID=A0ABY9Q5E8_9FIRM|nr:fibronectin type III domain-containing protein [Terrisporobacter mayombei]MCC3868756.1 fibronectin type III domain-containing protein [Terrisporobacter mayombei]WMT83117.1 hypothetical protein TEMA_36150 [Terrisporobacter mayombei]
MYKTIKSSQVSYTSVKVSWNEAKYAGGYEIYRSTSKDGKYTKVATIKNGNTTSYTNRSLTKGRTYYYKIRAYKLVNEKKENEEKVNSYYSDIKVYKN